MPLLKNAVIGNDSFQEVLQISGYPWGSLNVVASNTNENASKIEIRISSSLEHGLVNTVEPGALIPAGGRFEMSCRLVQQDERIFVKAPAGVVIRAEANLALE